MYNLNAPNSKFKVGTKIRTASCIGLDSDKTGIVIKHFNSDDGYLMRLKSKGWVPVKLENTIDTYLPKEALFKLINDEKK